MGKFKAIVCFAGLSLFVAFTSLAQGPEGPPPDEDEVPVDGGVGFLLAAGAAWGIKKLKDSKE